MGAARSPDRTAVVRYPDCCVDRPAALAPGCCLPDAATVSLDGRSRGRLRTRTGFCSAGWIQRSGVRDENGGSRPEGEPTRVPSALLHWRYGRLLRDRRWLAPPFDGFCSGVNEACRRSSWRRFCRCSREAVSSGRRDFRFHEPMLAGTNVLPGYDVIVRVAQTLADTSILWQSRCLGGERSGSAPRALMPVSAVGRADGPSTVGVR